MLQGCLGRHTSATSRGHRGQCHWTGRLGWWSPSLKRGTEGCVPTFFFCVLDLEKAFDRVLGSLVGGATGVWLAESLDRGCSVSV